MSDEVGTSRERELQSNFSWARGINFPTYNTILGHYQAKSVLKHARGRRLLDMPCGDGILTAYLSEQFDEVTGVDASESHLRSARERLPEADLYHGLIEEVELPGHYDTVTMLNILEHVIDPVLTLRKAASFVAPDGVLIAHVPNSQAVNRHIAVRMGTLTDCGELSPFDIDVAGHRRSYDLAALVRDVEASGLRVEATGGVFYKMLSTPQMDWLLANGPWEEGGFGWGRVGSEPRDWRSEFCRACYEYGSGRPEDCNVIYVCATVA